MGKCCDKSFISENEIQTKQSLNRVSLTPAIALKRDIRNEYKFGKVLGHGNFGTVRIATLKIKDEITQKSDTHLKKYAVKTISKPKIKVNDLKKEIEILLSCDHPNIIKLHFLYSDQKYFHLVTDLCEGGELFDKIIEKKKLTEQETSKIFIKMLSAIMFLHENGICHRDIKPENFLFESKKPDAEIKLIDFGLSNKFSDTNQNLSTIAGSPFFIAPEVLEGKYGEQCDTWSLGIVLYTMLSGSVPFGGDSTSQIFKNIQQEPVQFDMKAWQTVSEDAKDLIRLMLVKDPKQRISIYDALEHPWFATAPTEEYSIEPQILQQLRNYSNDINIRKEAMKVIVKNLGVDEIQNLIKVFYQIDKDRSGYIDANELQMAMQQSGMNVALEEIQKIMIEADYDKNGKINYSEFIAATLNSKIYMNEEKLYAAFNHFDIDKSGYITAANIKESMKRGNKEITDEEIQKLIKDVDFSKDNQISFDEFKYMMDPDGLIAHIFTDEKDPDTQI